MRDNRKKWKFYKHPSKKCIDKEGVRYWKVALPRLLKVGMEFEYNLPQQKGICRGDSAQCPCIQIEKGCWKDCSNIELCKKTPCFDTCANQTAPCKPEKCEACVNYKFVCLEMNCIEFVSACFTCEKFDKNCGTCPKKYEPNKDPKQIRAELEKVLQPSNTYGKVSKYGVVSIVQDGSLEGDKGVEIITVGRRPDYYEYYTMAKAIIDNSGNRGAYLNERCSSHMHLLTSHYDARDEHISEMEKDMPEIIAANYHQLCRRYQNAITWMTIALDKVKHMTRWEKFRVSILDVSAVDKSMSEVNQKIMRKCSDNNSKDKYGWANYTRMRFEGNKITRFHVEMRTADSTMCPSYYAALACLFYALAIKAVEISRYGVLKVGSDEWMAEANAMKASILNGCGGYDGVRVANTQHVLEYREQFVEQSVDMLNQLKGILMGIGPAYDVLYKLAQEPIALRRIEGKKWDQIEKELEIHMSESDQIEFRMHEIIDLRLIEECKDVKEWIAEVGKMANDDEEIKTEITSDNIKHFVESKMRDGDAIWSDSLGAIITI